VVTPWPIRYTRDTQGFSRFPQMRPPAPLALLLFASSVLADTGSIDVCREAHVNDTAAHIACLEEALRAKGTGARSEPSAAPVEETTGNAVAQATLGAEQVQRKVESSEPVRVRVVSATYTRQGLGMFRLEGGQLWRETMTSPAHLRLDPDTEYSARIERNRLGRYRMYVDGIRWMKRVERLE
jgi:hypothetical protein